MSFFFKFAAGAFVDLHLGKCAFIEPPPVGEFCHNKVRPICDKMSKNFANESVRHNEDVGVKELGTWWKCV